MPRKSIEHKLNIKPSSDIEYIYVDEHIIVLDKPAWLLSVPGKGIEKEDSLATQVKQKYPTAEIVHRLDWATSGIIIMALTKQALVNLNSQFANRKTKKIYSAFLDGRAQLTDFEINLPLRGDWLNRPKQVVDYELGKNAKTIVNTIEINKIGENIISKVQLNPITGRTHQLRVHMQEIGYPILGDQLYADSDFALSFERLYLHAEYLKITHPNTNDDIEFKSKTPFN